MAEETYVWRVGEGAWYLLVVDTSKGIYSSATITFDGKRFSCSCGETDDKKLCDHVLLFLRVMHSRTPYFDLYHQLVTERQNVQTVQQNISTRANTQRQSTSRRTQRSRKQNWEDVVEQIKQELNGRADVDVEGNEILIIKRANIKDWQWKKLWNYIQRLGAKRVRGRSYAWHIPISDAVRALRE